MPPECSTCGTHWKDGAPNCVCDREPRNAINALRASLAAKDARIKGLEAIVSRCVEHELTNYLRREMLYDHPGDASIIGPKISRWLTKEEG